MGSWVLYGKLNILRKDFDLINSRRGILHFCIMGMRKIRGILLVFGSLDEELVNSRSREGANGGGGRWPVMVAATV